MSELIIIFFMVIALILMVVLVFLYKLTIAVGRLDQRLEQFAIHLRDLNLYDFQPADMGGMFGEATEVEADESRSTTSGVDDEPGRDETSPHIHRSHNMSDTTPLRKKF